jgi:hypothetical protein
MIVYKDWGKHLRLGNWWFNYAALLTISKRTGQQIHLPQYHAWSYMKDSPIIDMSDQYINETFHFPANAFSREELDKTYTYFAERNDKVININLGPNNQSEKWFLDEIDHVKRMLTFSPEAINQIKQKYNHILGNGKSTIGIGIRRGDFVGHGVFYQIPLEWYMKALEVEFPDWRNCNILFFSDHIEEIRTRFINKNFHFAEPNGTHTHADNFKYYHNNPMEQFILGTLCDHFIGGNSTFTWWQMWYVKNFNNGKVVHCGKNLSDEAEIAHGKNPDYYPESWILNAIT